MKKFFILLFAFALVGLPFALPAFVALGQGSEATPTGAPMLAGWTNTPSPSPTATNEPTPAAVWCHVTTGLQDGRVNVRACGSKSCAVLAIAQEGDALQEVTPGLWHEVKTGDNTTGFIFSKFCKKGQ